ncbi:tRNA (guanine(37)-N1)-methyltransferase isoform X1 [Anabrus simplex]|uniref:tRNA (guanine(37)-N1)-methyltransferase isoform X1 n=1 Tax=Anabrus simplex TaxID=316456 RepID=UPI0035A3C03B
MFLPIYRRRTLSLSVRYFLGSNCDAKQVKMIEVDIKKHKNDPFLLLPPARVRGMKVLDKGLFEKNVIVPWVLLDANQVSVAVKFLKKYFLKLINFKPLQPSSIILDGEEILTTSFEESTSQGSRRRAFLSPSLVAEFTDISEQDRLGLNKVNVTESSLRYSKLTLKYNNWKADEILKAILPQDDPLTSYSIIGHITHVNINEHLLPYKSVIGEVLLGKVVGCKTVVNKIDIIDNTYRNFKFELLCGENNFKTQTKENGCLYELDFSSVYWNPRLSTEHERIVQKLKTGDVLYDVFAGIGPFAIPISKKKCHVLANDLNPHSHKWLKQNGKLNKVGEFLKTFNKDGRLFLEEDVKRDMLEKWVQKEFKSKAFHITMNLPALAVTFLSVFNGMFKSEDISKVQNFPFVHVYCFVKGDEPSAGMLATKMVEEHLESELGKHLVEVILVRNVSPKKWMVRVSFKLWKELLLGLPNSFKDKDLVQDNAGCRKMQSDVNLEAEEPEQKRICLKHNECPDGEEQSEQQEQTQ